MIQDKGAPPADKGKSRKLIRKKLVEILKNSTDAGVNVFPNATIPPWHSELSESPVILVYVRSESASEYAVAPRELEREIDMAIEIVATGPEENLEVETPGKEKSLEDILDDIAEQVENAIDSDDSLQGTADNSILKNSELEFDSSGGSPIGSCRLTYGVTYYTHAPRDTSKQNANDDFETNKVDYNISDDDNTREATDTVDIPT